ncbi:MAG: HAD-IIIA family hydrolase [Clostridia bacterium]|nr:HAD-IIIA family hydrolase [Clostridia bacterium]
MKAVIMAGGFGKRLAGFYSDRPKPMVEICGKPVLEYQIENLRHSGITDIIIVVHHMKESIINYFGDGSYFGVKISYYEEKTPLGTAGALFRIKEQLSENFLLINGDLIFSVDFGRMIDFHIKNKALATLFVHPNSHPYDSELVVCDENNIVTDWFKCDGYGNYKNRVNAGIHILSREILYLTHGEGKLNLRADVIEPIISTGRVYAYSSAEYVKDMGTADRLRHVTADVENNIVSARRADKKQKVIFLDRDGTINKYKGYITSPKQLELINGAADAIRKINRSGYLAIIITNQPSIAMGRMSYAVLDEIHAKLDSLLGENGAYIDALYFCPHHPDKGFTGEKTELKIKCDCRKPSGGMIRKAAEDYNIDLSKSFMVGDSEKDVLAGLDAGCTPVFLTGGCDGSTDIPNIRKYKNLADFIKDELK